MALAGESARLYIPTAKKSVEFLSDMGRVRLLTMSLSSAFVNAKVEYRCGRVEGSFVPTASHALLRKMSAVGMYQTGDMAGLRFLAGAVVGHGEPDESTIVIALSELIIRRTSDMFR